MKYLVISCSHSPTSRSRPLSIAATEKLRALGAAVEHIDLAHLALPLCDGGACYDLPVVQALAANVAAANAILIATPVYNYDVNAAAKNLVELTGKAWSGKIVGFICAAGGAGSYMSVLGLANSLMLDFRCLIVPRFVYSPMTDPADPEFGEVALADRIDQLVAEVMRLAKALA